MLLISFIVIIVILDIYLYIMIRKELKEQQNELHELQISLAKHEQEHAERTVRINRKLNDLKNQIKED